jgi:hypothetical protein
MAALPSLGKPFQRLSTNSTSTETEYTYHTINDQVPLGSYTVPAGYNLTTGFLTIGNGVTYSIAGSMVCGGTLIAMGTGVVQATGTGIIHGN